ncbi:MAG: hypothetical protein EZS28_020426 [Streblomastix strix]|uniref:Decapping nuclease n=1 Tax=Streblomastix strix TaxID=222440 RepID=A0A5J4VN15_9EUKA|nr:MAG: hypothetical protein EZS28_020426 [Streblomastix strix]
MGITYEKDKYLCYNVQVTPICGSYPEPVITNKEDQTENKIEENKSSQKDDKVNSQQQQQQHERFLFDDNLIPNGQNIYREAIMNDNFSTFITHVEKQMQNVGYKRRCELITKDIENLNQEAQRLQTEIENINKGKQILSKDQQISLKLKQEDLDEVQYQIQQQVARKNEILYPQKRLFYGRSFETLCAGRPPNEETVLNQYGNPFVDFNYVEVVTLTNLGFKIGMAFEADTFRQQQTQSISQSSSSNSELNSESSNKTMNNSIEYIIQNNKQNEFITSKLNSVPPIFQSVELKTAFPPSSQRQKDNFYGKRMRNSWAQCYISGIPYIIFGFVDQNGILTDMRQYEVAQIPSLCKNYWSMDLMMKVLETVLAKIAQIIAIKIEEQKQSIIKQPDVKLVPIRFSVEIHVEGQEIILKVLPYSSIDIQSKTDLKSDILFSQRQ